VFDATIEAPVTIRNPDKPIGTHVFTAVARNGADLRWTAVTIDNGDDAKDALDRITIPQDVLDRIAPTALPRSSIIVSDEPLSRETNYRTEFVAVLNNQPQGGFVTRRPTADALVASDNVWGDAAMRGWHAGTSWPGNAPPLPWAVFSSRVSKSRATSSTCSSESKSMAKPRASCSSTSVNSSASLSSGFGSFLQRNWDSQSGNTRRRGGQSYPQARQGWW
jgi:hypothetical protein